MRNFNEREKIIIKRIAEYDFGDLKTMSLFMQEVYFKDIQDGAILINQAVNMQLQIIYFPKEDKTALRNIIEAILLLQYLFDVRYLSKVTLGGAPTISVMTSATKGQPQNINSNVKFPNGEYIDTKGVWRNDIGDEKYDYVKETRNNFNIIGTLCCGIFVSEDLKDLVKHNFQTLEQMQFKTTIRWTRIAAGLSFIGLLIAVILPFYVKTSLAEKEEIIKAIESTKIEIPESINSVITNDNLEVSITNEQIDVTVKNRQINATITNDTLNVKTTNR